MINFRKLRPLLNRVLVVKPEAVQKSKGGILLPDNKQEQLNIGTVVAVGPGRTLENGSTK